MSRDTLRSSSATATVGLGGVGTAAALRHTGLERAYDGAKRPPLAQEVKLLRRASKGRRLYLTGAGIGTLAVPTAAVGINHTVRDIHDRFAKSYMGGGSYVRAVDLSRAGRESVRRATARQTSKRRLHLADSPNFRSKQIWLGIDSPKGREVKVVPAVSRPFAPKEPYGSALRRRLSSVTNSSLVRGKDYGASARPNGQGGGTLSLKPRTSKKTMLHEQAHLQPQRNAQNFQRRYLQPRSRGREEGRANYLAGIKNYSSTRETTRGSARAFQEGYKEVTSNMTRAGTKRGLPKSFGKADPPPDRRSFLSEGVHGARAAITDRNQSLTKPAPVRLQAANYAVGGLVGSGTGALANRLLRGRLPGPAKAAAAAMTGITAGTLALPVQSRYTQRATHGRYEVTPTGVRRKKTKPKRPSTAATIVEGRSGRTTMSPAGIRDAMGPSALGKAESYPGSTLSHNQKRARVQAVGGIPILGDFSQAGAAAAMAPPPLRRRTAALQYGGSVTGGALGQVGGAALALGAARRFKSVQRGAEKVTSASDRATNLARSAVHLKPKTGPSTLERAALSASTHHRIPTPIRRGLSAATHNPKVAGAGLLLGGMVGGTAGGQGAYTAALRMEDRYKREHGLSKAAPLGPPLTRQEKKKLSRRKVHNAALSQIGGALGLGALAATIGGRKFPVLRTVQTPLLTAGAGVGGINAFIGAKVQRKEAEQTLASKSFLPEVIGRASQGVYSHDANWVSAATLTSRQRGAVRSEVNNSRFIRQMGLPKPQASNNRLYPQARVRGGVLKPTVTQHAVRSGHHSNLLGLAAPNGRGGGHIDIFPGAYPSTLKHEQAHIAPRRNPATLQDRSQNPRRAGHEEGRADYLARGHDSTYPKDQRYPGEPRFRQGYEEVQNKMRAAGTKVHKSWIAPAKTAGGWKSATTLTADERHGVRAGITRSRALSNYRRYNSSGWAPSSKGRKIYDGRTTSRGELKPTVLMHRKPSKSDTVFSGHTAMAQPNGRGGGRLDVFPLGRKKSGAVKPRVLRHELAHLAPKRNPHALYERIGADPVRHGREEGRADYLASGHFSTYKDPNRYYGGGQFRQGYEEVHNKMRAAGTKFGKGFRVTGLRRAPAVRMGTIRQTRYRSGVTRTSTVRGGLA